MARPVSPPPHLDDTDRLLINRLQDGFPIAAAPFAEVAAALDLQEEDVIRRIRALLDSGVLTRFGPLYKPEAMGGAVTLAAMAVPADRFESVTETVNAFPEVAHNYARSHTLNMWFVVATATAEDLSRTLDAIAEKTGLTVLSFPKQNEYFLDFRVEA